VRETRTNFGEEFHYWQRGLVRARIAATEILGMRAAYILAESIYHLVVEDFRWQRQPLFLRLRLSRNRR
jgi:hypothetical protein